jgi:hypothetical protein
MAEWPRMPYLNDELREWIAAQLATLGVDEIALYAIDPQRGQDEERRVLVATEVGLIDGWYAPRGGSSARYGFTARLWPWQAVRGVDLRSETYRVWALEHRTRWWLRLARPGFEAETDAPELGAALCDIAKVCAVMAEPAGWQAAQEEVPVRREPLRVVPAVTPPVPPEAGTDVEMVAPTGRPAVPPPMTVTPAPAPEPRALRPMPAAPAPEVEPDVEAAPAAEPASLSEGATDTSGDAQHPETATPDERHEPPEDDAAVATSADGIDSPAPVDDGAARSPEPIWNAASDSGADEQEERVDEQPAADDTPAMDDAPAAEAPAHEGAPLPDDAPVAAAAAASPAADGSNGVGPPRPRERGIGLPIGPFRRPTAPPSAVKGSGAQDEEEVLNLGELGGGEGAGTADPHDGDPLGLRGPLHR